MIKALQVYNWSLQLNVPEVKHNSFGELYSSFISFLQMDFFVGWESKLRHLQTQKQRVLQNTDIHTYVAKSPGFVVVVVVFVIVVFYRQSL